MSILNELLGSQNEEAISGLARQFSISEKDAQKGLAGLLPSLMKGMKSNVSDEDGDRSLLEALENGNHSRYLEDGSIFSDPAAVEDGNGILGHLLGSKQRSREVASQASNATGLSSTLLKKLLPIAAAMLMGGLGRKASAGGLLGSLLGGDSKKQSSGIASFLDFDNDGSIADDIFSIAMKFI